MKQNVVFHVRGEKKEVKINLFILQKLFLTENLASKSIWVYGDYTCF